MYTKKQQIILVHTKKKVADFINNNPRDGHKIDHVARVADWAKKIAQAEKANIFLCELAGWLHDIGRSVDSPRRHHELSYELCQKWFREDEVLVTLSRREKTILLYSVLYHWNNAADKYTEAIILRDADKLDLFGKVGIKRFEDFYKSEDLILERMRFLADDVFWLRTKTARKYFQNLKMFEPVYKYIVAKLKKQIKPVEL